MSQKKSETACQAQTPVTHAPVSLAPLTPEQALRALLSIPNPEKAIADAAKPKTPKGRSRKNAP